MIVELFRHKRLSLELYQKTTSATAEVFREIFSSCARSANSPASRYVRTFTDARPPRSRNRKNHEKLVHLSSAARRDKGGHLPTCPPDFLTAPNAGHRSNIEFWRILPIETICYVDNWDLSINEHSRRAREIVNVGSVGATVADVQTKELRILRPSGVRISLKAIRVPEMPWFRVPVASANGNE